MKESLPTLPDQESKKVLTFEEFRYRDEADVPKYDNFFIYFDGTEFAEFYREKEYYKKFASEYPDIAESLCEKIQSKRNLSKNNLEFLKALESFERELYEAYKIMRSYGVSDQDLFS